jgi:hypothetical protein
MMKPIVKTDLPPWPEKGSDGKDPRIQKTVLRLDSFLGEWLTPEYFELITPPPSSALMLAGAKAELLRREDYSSQISVASHVHSNSGSGQLWSSPISAPADRTGSVDSDLDLHGLESLPKSGIPLAETQSTTSRPNSESGPKVRFVPPTPPMRATEPSGYIAPTPHYAISMSGKIPEGYVAHAKDACVGVDYQWDSMREPFFWGDGGQFGEEWTAMHHRFRKGVQCLVDWYTTAENPAEILTRTVVPAAKSDDEFAIDDTEDEETDTVVIIVSHGAGCNALIGAITHQPVLMDVGIASLTMAVRKPEKGAVDAPDRPPLDVDTSSPVTSGKESVPIHQYYDMKIFANTEHLRTAGAATQNYPPTSNKGGMVLNSRGRLPNVSPPSSVSPFTYTDSFNRAESRSNSANASLGSMRRTSHNSYSVPRTAVINTSGIPIDSSITSSSATGLSRSPSIGLWSPVASRLNVSQDAEDEDLDDMLPDFDHTRKFAPVRKSTKDSDKIEIPPQVDETKEEAKREIPTPTSPIRIPTRDGSEKSDDTAQTPPQIAAGGLWGSPRPPGEAERLRDMSSMKRRWTVNERSA